MKQVIEASYFINRWHELNDELSDLQEHYNNIVDEIKELDEDHPDYLETRLGLEEAFDEADKQWNRWNAENMYEYDTLTPVADALDNIYGRHCILYHDDYMETYAKEFIEEHYPDLSIGSFPYDCVTVDYDAVASRMMADMSVIEIGNNAYYYNE